MSSLPLTSEGTIDWKALRDHLAETSLMDELEWHDDRCEIIASPALCDVGDEVNSDG